MGNDLYRCFIFTLATLLTLIAPSRIHEEPNKSLTKNEFIFWSVGQGDLITYISKNFCWFFDLGGSRPLNFVELRELKNRCFMKHVSAFISHLHQDHIQFYKNVDQVIPIDKIYFSHLDSNSKTTTRMLAFFKKKNIPILILHQGEKIQMDDNELHCLWPRKQNKIRDENSKSLTLLFKHKNRSVLLTGDLQGRYENSLPLFKKVDILKVAHHGSGSSTGERLLDRIKPKTCIISVGKNNKYGHPKNSLLNRLHKSSCAVMRTDRLGTIRFGF